MSKISVTLQLAWGVRSWREKRGWSVAELAARLHMPPEWVDAVEADDGEVHLDDLQALADALKINIPDLFSDQKPRSDKPVENSAGALNKIA